MRPSKEVKQALATDWAVTAVHEGGHAVAHIVLNVPMSGAKVAYERAGDQVVVNGYVHADDKNQHPDPLLVIALAGAAAETMWCRRYTKLTGKEIKRRVECGASHDLRQARQLLRHSGLTYSQARRQALQLVTHNWAAIIRVGRVLGRRGELSSTQIARLV